MKSLLLIVTFMFFIGCASSKDFRTLAANSATHQAQAGNNFTLIQNAINKLFATQTKLAEDFVDLQATQRELAAVFEDHRHELLIKPAEKENMPDVLAPKTTPALTMELVETESNENEG